MSDTNTSRLPIWLVVSLIANALLIGLIIGGGLGQRKAGPPPGGGPGGSEQALIRGIDRSLPEDQRHVVRQAFREAFRESRPERVRVREARRALSRLLAADVYDADAVREGFRQLRDADAAMNTKMHDVLANQFGSLTLEQRRAIIRDLNRRGPRGGPRDGERRPPPPRPGPPRD